MLTLYESESVFVQQFVSRKAVVHKLAKYPFIFYFSCSLATNGCASDESQSTSPLCLCCSNMYTPLPLSHLSVYAVQICTLPFLYLTSLSMLFKYVHSRSSISPLCLCCSNMNTPLPLSHLCVYAVQICTLPFLYLTSLSMLFKYEHSPPSISPLCLCCSNMYTPLPLSHLSVYAVQICTLLIP